MGRGINLLSARGVATLLAPGRYSDGGGLYLLVRKRGEVLERLWVFRYKRGARAEAREKTLSIGPARDVSLAAARTAAAKCREALERGEDPKRAVRTQDTAGKTFGEEADGYMDRIESGFKSKATRANWRRTLGDRYCARLRKKPIAEINTEDVLEVLTPVWQSKPETARKMRARIETVLDAAKVRGLRSGENPARWRGHLKLLLGKQTRKKGHHRALPYKEAPEFMAKLAGLNSVSALALEWTILTAARTAMSAKAKRAEVNLEERVWTIPGSRMKEGKEHRVPLCDRCLEIFEEMQAYPSQWLFPGRRPKRPLSDMAMAECLKGLGADATVHGFRSTFRDWAGDMTAFPRDLAEMALAHKVGDEVEVAYRRSDALERRRELMIAWERYCRSANAGDNVVLLMSHTTNTK